MSRACATAPPPPSCRRWPRESQADKHTIAEFQRRTGFDPAQADLQHHARLSRKRRARAASSASILRGEITSTRRALVAYARDELQKNGDDLVATKRGRFTLWSSRRDPAVVGFFIDEQTFVLGAGSWGAAHGRAGGHRTTRATAPPPTWIWSTWSNAPPARTRSGAPRWSPRRRAARWPPTHGFAEAASDLHAVPPASTSARGSRRCSIADVATADGARALASKVTESLRDAKRNPQVLMLGLGPYLDGRRARSPIAPSSCTSRWATRPSTTWSVASWPWSSWRQAIDSRLRRALRLTAPSWLPQPSRCTA